MNRRTGTEDIKRRFGRAVKLRRQEFGYSQEELAERAGLHRTYISDVERGARNPSLGNVERIAQALEISIVDLFVKYGVTPESDEDGGIRRDETP